MGAVVQHIMFLFYVAAAMTTLFFIAGVVLPWVMSKEDPFAPRDDEKENK